MAPEEEKSIITVVGVGGAGGNAVNHMRELGIKGVTFMACNTDRQALDTLNVDIKIQLGPGLGAGNDPKKGRELAVRSLDDVRHQLQSLGTQMLFIAAGMGGGTGTGASPVIAELAREMDILTVAIVTLPWASEGMNRYDQACRGIEELRKWVDSLLVINNDNISKLYGRLSLKQAFGKADDVLAMAAKGIAEIITLKSFPVNVDFADVQKVMSRSGHAHMAVATATGENRAIEVAEASLKSPLLDNNSIVGASYILLQISVANLDNLMFDEVKRIIDCIQSRACTRDADNKLHTATVIWGSSAKPSLGDDALELVIVATGFDPSRTPAVPETEDVFDTAIEPREPAAQPKPPQKPAKKETWNITRDHVIPSRDDNKYSNIQRMLSQPSYLTRKMKIDNTATGQRGEMLESEYNEGRTERKDQSLF